MRHTMKWMSVVTGSLAVGLALMPAGAASSSEGSGGSSGSGPRHYEVKIRVLTETQALTPPVIATHRGNFNMFEVGQLASVGIKEVAENGNVPALATAVGQAGGVSRVAVGTTPVVPDGLPGSGAGDSVQTYTIAGGERAKYISFASMLICTNDGFTGVNQIRLPSDVGDRFRMGTFGYDSGTEVNTEDFADIVPPCQGLVGISSSDTGSGVSDPTLFENGVIRHHEGIAGGDDLLVDPHGWDVDRPVVRISVTRVG